MSVVYTHLQKLPLAYSRTNTSSGLVLLIIWHKDPPYKKRQKHGLSQPDFNPDLFQTSSHDSSFGLLRVKTETLVVSPWGWQAGAAVSSLCLLPVTYGNGQMGLSPAQLCLILMETETNLAGMQHSHSRCHGFDSRAGKCQSQTSLLCLCSGSCLNSLKSWCRNKFFSLVKT